MWCFFYDVTFLSFFRVHSRTHTYTVTSRYSAGDCHTGTAADAGDQR
jgi:hypothetical protein